MVHKRNFQRLHGRMRLSLDPDYYYNKRLRLEQKMVHTVVIPPPPQPPSTNLPILTDIKEKKKPGRKKKVIPPKNPITREERTVVLRWD